MTAELVDRHSTTLETLLAALRSPALGDDAARKSATDVAARALVGLRTLNDRTTELVEEPVATAFQRLREDLKPLMNFSGIDVQFIEPPVKRPGPCPVKWPTRPGRLSADWCSPWWTSPASGGSVPSGIATARTSWSTSATTAPENCPRRHRPWPASPSASKPSMAA